MTLNESRKEEKKEENNALAQRKKKFDDAVLKNIRTASNFGHGPNFITIRKREMNCAVCRIPTFFM